MKRFILKGVLFILIAIAVDALVGIIFNKMYDSATGGETGEEKFVYNDLEADMLFIGSSRCFRHYNPQVFQDTLSLSAYNCGISGQGILMLYPRISLISSNHHPKIIVYDVYDGFDLQDRSDRDKYMEKMRVYYDSNAEVKDVMDKIDKFEKYKILSSAYRYNSKLFRYISDSFKSRDVGFNGFTPVKSKMSYTVQDNPDDIRIKCDDLKLHYIEELIKFCSKENITLFFALSPMYNAKDSHVYQPLFELADRYGVTVLDHYADFILSTNKDCFSDRVHLNEEGANVYSSLLASEIKEFLNK